VLAPVAAVEVLPLWRRSWKWRSWRPVCPAGLDQRHLQNVWTERTNFLAGEQQTVGRGGHVAFLVVLERRDDHLQGWRSSADSTPSSAHRLPSSPVAKLTTA
jgi:hypothetical protein